MIIIDQAAREDLKEILALQKLAFQTEAELLGDYSIEPLRQTLEELEEQFSEGPLLAARVEARGPIIGTVRAKVDGGRARVMKLAVHPRFRNQGLGAALLAAIEKLASAKAFELMTSSKSLSNLHLYLKMGYREFKRAPMVEGVDFVFLEKTASSPGRGE
jgi:ribosomal protein S18 acetylase RimI-like enzyme